jgi:hypothetical protein
LSLLVSLLLATPIKAQDTVTGAFEGRITDKRTGAPIAGASVQFINQGTGVPIAKRTNQDGRFYQALLQPGTYTIRATAPGYRTEEVERRLVATRNNIVIPVPISLEPEGTPPTTPPNTTTPPTTTPGNTTTPPVATASPGTGAAATTGANKTEEEANLVATINQTDGRRGGAFTELEVSTLPLGATTLIRTFDELAFLVPGVFLPPQTGGLVAGPGVGPGVGSAGQFSVNGLRSRSNNFTVDGSDNNDEDIGVRRQGFLALVPQPIESIREYQIITLLAPAQFGRNIGAQVNAISKSGTSETHGAIFGLFNASQLNSRRFYDSAGFSGSNPVTSQAGQRVFLDGTPQVSHFLAGGEDSLTLFQGGFVLGGPLDVDRGPGRPPRMFYFLSAEGQILNAVREQSFAVPTIEQRGGPTCTQVAGVAPNTVCTRTTPGGATGLFRDPFTGVAISDFPTTFSADPVFSLFPFPNNPNGVHGRNTFTKNLPASGQGKIISGKFDTSGKFQERNQQFTARYNFTDDWRDVPSTGGALFSSLRPRVRTQNFSTFLNSEISGPNATKPLFNQFRFSYGRTRLIFDELRDTEFLIPSQSLPDVPFLLNAPSRLSLVLPNSAGNANTGDIEYLSGGTTEDRLGVVGQVRVAGFSPLGADVFNFPQRRVNNTFQLADTLVLRVGSHSLAFGTDSRRSELNSDLCPNCRPLLTFNGAPRLLFNPNTRTFVTSGFFRPEELVGVSAATGFSQTLASGSSSINLRYYQINFFGQDEWRMSPSFSLSFGLRYEYNSPPVELNNKIEGTFVGGALSLAPGFRQFIDNRTSIFESDRNNLAPRVGFAWSPKWFGADKTTVIRGGYGLYYDQVLGAVVSQSRSVFPSFLNVNLAGGLGNPGFFFDIPFTLANPSDPGFGLVSTGTLNRLDPNFTLQQQINFINNISTNEIQSSSGLSITLPARNLQSPMAHHYSLTFEQQFSSSLVFSASYVGTLGRNLLRYTTPNLGPNSFLVPLFYEPGVAEPEFFGLAFAPGTRISAAGTVTGGRPVPSVGSVGIYETTARSRYDALQLQLRGRMTKAFQYQVNYTFSQVKDDVSDVFDLAGAPALPQDSDPRSSQRFEGEYAPANFDSRHRMSYNFIYDLPTLDNLSEGNIVRLVLGNLQLAGSGIFQTGQPFTVNSIFDVNLDGNLTDRPNSLAGITRTGDRSRPYTVSNPLTLLAPVGSNGSVPRNALRAGNVLELNLSLIKRFKVTEQQNLMFRMDVFNFTDRANFGIPVRFLEDPSFGRTTDTVTPGRRIQFALKYNF